MWTTISMGAVLVSSFVSSAPGLYEGDDTANQRIARQRTWGLGSALGGGMFGGAVVGSRRSIGFFETGPTLPSLELQFFRDNGNSIDISVPISYMMINALNGTAVLSASVYYNYNLGDDWVRFLLGPGIGFSAGSVSDVVIVSLDVHAVVGVEMLTESRAFGFKLMARPWVEVGVGVVTGYRGGAVFVGGVGALILIGFSWYDTR